MGLFSAPAVAQQQATTIEKTKHGSWTIRCLEADPSVCAMTQVGNNDRNEPLLRAEFHKTPERTTDDGRKIVGRMVITTPIGVLLPAGVTLSIDGRQTGAAGYQLCNPTQCIVAELVSGKFITELKKGTNVKMTVRSPDGKESAATLSLSGFTKAFNSL